MKKIKFCDICGEMLQPLKLETTEMVGICKSGHIDMSFSLESSQENKIEEKGEGVHREYEGPGFPHKCKKCGYEECDLTEIGAPYADESDIYLYKCKKCKFTERQADGSGNK